MLAILKIEMQWLKENRTPIGAVQRQKYYHPMKIEEDVALTGEGVFLKCCNLYQVGKTVLYGVHNAEQMNRKLQEQDKGKAFSSNDECEYKKVPHKCDAFAA